jgi:DNA-binding beta-propeller fold protein YncE
MNSENASGLLQSHGRPSRLASRRNAPGSKGAALSTKLEQLKSRDKISGGRPEEGTLVPLRPRSRLEQRPHCRGPLARVRTLARLSDETDKASHRIPSSDPSASTNPTNAPRGAKGALRISRLDSLSNSFEVGGDDRRATSAGPASAGPSVARTQGGPIASLWGRLRTKPRAASAAVGLVLVAVGAFPSTSPASQLHAFSAAFGDPGSGAGQLSLLFPQLSPNQKPESAGSGVAVDEETGDVYVADSGNHRISEFDPSGPPAERFLRSFGADVGGPGIDVCTAFCVEGTATSAPGGFETPTFIAVDNDPASPSHGDVYVADGDLISKFTAAGALVSSWADGGQLDGSGAPGGPFEAVEGIAVDRSGDLWVQSREQVIYEFDQAGLFSREWDTGLGAQPTGIAVDGTGHLYAFDGFAWGPIHRFTFAGSDEGAVFRRPSASRPGEPNGFFSSLAASQADGELYADDEGESIAALSSRCEPADGECTPVETFGEGRLTAAAGIAVDSADGTVYASETATDEIDAFPVVLEALLAPASEVEATSATADGSVDPKGTPVTSCAFQYGPTAAYGAEAPCLDGAGEEVGTAANPIITPTAVHGSLVGLPSGAVQHFRLRVGNQGSQFLSSEDAQLTTKALATAEAVSATDVGAESATLGAEVDPHGLAVGACSFQYGTDTSYGTTVPCLPSSIAAGTTPVPVTAPIAGLSPNTTYHFRVVLTDADGTSESPDHTFVFLSGSAVESGCANETLRSENGSLSLPDCRAYELVTPMDKNGSYIGALFSGNIPPAIAADGGSLIAPAIQCFADARSCVGTRITQGEPFRFSRSESGWSPQALALPASIFESSSSWRFNAETGAALFIAPGASAGDEDWYVRASGGAVSDLGPLWEPGLATSLRVIEPAPSAASADFSHLVYETQEPIWPSFDHGGSKSLSLYEYPGSSGSGPELVGVSGGPGSDDLIGTCGTGLPSGPRIEHLYNALSSDGRTLYFSVAPCEHGSGANAATPVPVDELFVRIDGERTVAISEPGALSANARYAACESAGCQDNITSRSSFRSAQFEGASVDGTRVYFTSPQQLTDQGSEDPRAADVGSKCPIASGPGGCNLYLYEDPQDPQRVDDLIDVSAGDTSGLGPEVQGLVALSPDGSHVYFVAKGVLTASPNLQGQTPVEGAENLYLYERDAAHPQGRLTFLTALSPSDSENWGGPAEQSLGAANVTPDGRFLVFTSHRGLTPDAAPGEGESQVYRYDASTAVMSRVSIGARGFDDDGNPSEGPACAGRCGAAIVEALKTTFQRSGPPRPDPTMSDDGSRVFFKSPLALTPGALDKAPAGADGRLAQNIYEWEADGTRADGHTACEESSGCVSLISDGRDVAEASKLVEDNVELFGTEAEGANVFFATSERLTWQDTDSQRDYYDARIGGGFAAPPVAVVCEADSCRGAGTQAGAASTPASASLDGPEEGPGHPRARKCRNGFAKKSGSCIRRKPRHHHARRHHKKQKRRRRASSGRGGRK